MDIITVIAAPDRAAGVGDGTLVFELDQQRPFELLSVAMVIVADATVVNRFPCVQIAYNNARLFDAGYQTGAITAGQTVLVSFRKSGGQNVLTTGVRACNYLGDVIIPATGKINLFVDGGAVGDAWVGIRVSGRYLR